MRLADRFPLTIVSASGLRAFDITGVGTATEAPTGDGAWTVFHCMEARGRDIVVEPHAVGDTNTENTPGSALSIRARRNQRSDAWSDMIAVELRFKAVALP